MEGERRYLAVLLIAMRSRPVDKGVRHTRTQKDACHTPGKGTDADEQRAPHNHQSSQHEQHDHPVHELPPDGHIYHFLRLDANIQAH